MNIGFARASSRRLPSAFGWTDHIFSPPPPPRSKQAPFPSTAPPMPPRRSKRRSPHSKRNVRHRTMKANGCDNESPRVYRAGLAIPNAGPSIPNAGPSIPNADPNSDLNREWNSFVGTEFLGMVRLFMVTRVPVQSRSWPIHDNKWFIIISFRMNPRGIYSELKFLRRYRNALWSSSVQYNEGDMTHFQNNVSWLVTKHIDSVQTTSPLWSDKGDGEYSVGVDTPSQAAEMPERPDSPPMFDL